MDQDRKATIEKAIQFVMGWLAMKIEDEDDRDAFKVFRSDEEYTAAHPKDARDEHGWDENTYALIQPIPGDVLQEAPDGLRHYLALLNLRCVKKEEIGRLRIRLL